MQRRSSLRSSSVSINVDLLAMKAVMLSRAVLT